MKPKIHKSKENLKNIKTYCGLVQFEQIFIFSNSWKDVTCIQCLSRSSNHIVYNTKMVKKKPISRNGKNKRGRFGIIQVDPKLIGKKVRVIIELIQKS